MADDKATIIDAQADFDGKLKGKDAVILGRFKGEVTVAGRLVIGEGAKVEATVGADIVEVAGELNGDVQARSLVLGDKARVQGTVRARVLVVKEGAWLNGSVSAGEAAAKPADKPVEIRPISSAGAAPGAHGGEKPADKPAALNPEKGDKAGA
jgi:cytoskeletal protein CcmA (bactofilin family)